MSSTTFQPQPSTPLPTIWVNPQSMFDRVVLLREDALIVANPDRAVAEQLQSHSASTGSADAAIGQPSAVIPLQTITKVTSAEQSDVLTVHYVANGKPRFSTILLANQATRDAVLHQLQARLGAAFSFRRVVQSPLRASLRPAFFTLLVAIGTSVLYQGALQMAAGDMPRIRGRAALLKAIITGIVSALGPTGVLALGGILLLACVIWLIKRASRSRVILHLERSTAASSAA